MYSFNFPNMLSTVTTNLISDHEATASNTKLLLLSWKNTMLGDPFFGTNLKRFVYEQGSEMLRDLIIDDIHTSLAIFMPQLVVLRKNISVYIDKYDVYVDINCINTIDGINDLFTIKLTDENNA